MSGLNSRAPVSGFSDGSSREIEGDEGRRVERSENCVVVSCRKFVEGGDGGGGVEGDERRRWGEERRGAWGERRTGGGRRKAVAGRRKDSRARMQSRIAAGGRVGEGGRGRENS